MKNTPFFITIVLLFLISGFTLTAQTVVTYPLPSIYTKSDQVTSLTINGQNVDVIRYSEYDHAHFSFDGSAEIKITVKSDITKATVSPLAKGIKSVKSGRTLTFTITQSTYMIVKIDALREIVIAADPLETDVPNASVKPILDITKAPYNADPTGVVLATEAINQALRDATASPNGATVYVPKGLFVVDRSILFTSNTDMYLEGGAVIRSNGDSTNYTKFTRKASLSLPVTWILYTASKTENLKIYGRGMIDANGYYMRTTNKLAANVFTVRHCKNITIDGITFRDGNFWSFQTVRAENINITNTKHLNRINMVENDAMDICESRNVLVKHTIAISEDDAYSTKVYNQLIPYDSINGYFRQPLDNVTFDDCFGWSNCTTFKIGDGCVDSQTNVTYKNSYHYKGMQAIKINHMYGKGKYKNILYDNIDVETLGGRYGDLDRRWFVVEIGNTSGTGPIEDVMIKNINIRPSKTGQTSSSIKGYSLTAGVSNLTLKYIKMTGVSGYACSLADLNIGTVNSYVTNFNIIPFNTGDVIAHDTIGNLENEIKAKYSKLEEVKFIALAGDACLSYADCRAIVAAFPNLVGINLSFAKFENNAIPDAVSGVGAFEGLPVGGIKLAKDLSAIGSNAFRNCRNLTAISAWGASVKDGAFMGCSKFTSIYFNTVTIPSTLAFENGVKMYVPYGTSSSFSALSNQIILDGAIGSEYKLSTPDDLASMYMNINVPNKKSTFVLTQNIDLTNWITNNSDYDIRNGGWKAIYETDNTGEFTFDGNGHFISGLKINRPDLNEVGFFGTISGKSTFKNLGLASVSIKGKTYAGAILGYGISTSNILIEKCFVSGSIEGNGTSGGVAALAGGTKGTFTIKNCYAEGSVLATGDRAGGLLGYGDVATGPLNIENSYAMNTVEGKGTAGGIMSGKDGRTNVPTIKNCIALNEKVIGNLVTVPVGKYTGRIMGGGTADSHFINNYAYKDMICGAVELNNRMGTDASKEEITLKSLYETNLIWDFDTIWVMGNEAYPFPVLKDLEASIQPKVFPAYLMNNANSKLTVNPISIYVSGNNILITGKAYNSIVTIYNLSGNKVMESMASTVAINSLAKGVYILGTEGRFSKIIRN